MAASRDRVLKRCSEILNVCAPGTYSATISTLNKTRNADAIADMVDEAGLMLLKAIGERPNEFRNALVTDEIVENGDEMPEHIGLPAAVEITLWSGGPVRHGQRIDYKKVVSYRENPHSVYGDLAHDDEDSPLAGYYDIWNDRFYFTGFEATVYVVPTPLKADLARTNHGIPDVMENTWIKLAVGEAAKVGTGGYEQAVIDRYAQAGLRDLEMFKAGGRQFAEVDEPQPTSAVHLAATK